MSRSSRDLGDLVPAMEARVELVYRRCEERGVVMRPFFTRRDPWDQAKLWRQSRSREEIENGGVRGTRIGLKQLRQAGAHFLVRVIEEVGPQHGRWATNAPPGLSWHQWDEALDSFWLVDGRAVWGTSRGGAANGYRVYREEALRAGLHIGPRGDWPHVQLRAESSPYRLMSLGAISEEMERRYARRAA